MLEQSLKQQHILIESHQNDILPMRCFCPPDSCVPLAPQFVSYPFKHKYLHSILINDYSAIPLTLGRV